MKPFLLFVCRPSGVIADMEWEEIHRFGKLEPGEIVAHRLELPGPLPDLDDYSGVIITGSPYSLMADIAARAPAQIVMEEKLAEVCDEILERDFPTLGICYGLQILALQAGGSLTWDYPETISAPWVDVTRAGRVDPLLAHVGDRFQAYVGHAESIGRFPDSMTVLATSEAVPVQMARFGKNVYGTQFHPEISREGSEVRIGLYGGTYFDPADRERVLEECLGAYTDHTIITTFIETYRSSS